MTVQTFEKFEKDSELEELFAAELLFAESLSEPKPVLLESLLPKQVLLMSLLPALAVEHLAEQSELASPSLGSVARID
jgi:hypothetical protein